MVLLAFRAGSMFCFADWHLVFPRVVFIWGVTTGECFLWARLDWRNPKLFLSPEDMQRSVEPVSNQHVLSWQRQIAVWCRKDLVACGVELERHVVVDKARALEADNVVEIKRPDRAMNILESIEAGKPGVMCGSVRLFKESVRIFNRRDVSITQGFDEPILLSAVRTLDAALRLRAVGVDDLGAEHSERTGSIGMLGTVVEDASSVEIDLVWNAVAFEIHPQGNKSVSDVFGRNEEKETAARRVIDEHEEGTGRAASFEPVVRASVELNEFANGGSAWPLLPVRFALP